MRRMTVLALLIACLFATALSPGRIESLPEQPAPNPQRTIRALPARAFGTWVSGVVRDISGKPAPGATVFAFATYHGGIRMYEMVEKAETDAQGRYEIQGKMGLDMFSAVLVAHQPGKPPALAWMTLPDSPWVEFKAGQARPIAPAVESPRIDLAISDRGGRMDVRVLRDGKPAAGVSVMMYYESAQLLEQWAFGTQDETRDKIQAIFNPVRTADADGKARFEALPPGTYTVHAVDGGEINVRSLARGYLSRGQNDHAWGTGQGVAVRAGESHDFAMTIYPQPNRVRFAAQRHDGQPLSGEHTPIDYSAVLGRSFSSTSLKLDANGHGTFVFERVGLQRVSVKYRDPMPKQIPLRVPYYAGEAIVAVSPLLIDAHPVKLTADYRAGATLVARVLDAAGNPLPTDIELAGAGGNTLSSQTSKGDESVRFEGLFPGTYVLRAMLPGQPPVVLESYSKSLPDDRELANRTEILWQAHSVRDRGVHEITLRAQPVGYIRGVLHPAGQRKTEDYAVYPEHADSLRGARFAYLRETGQFVAGPFAPGRVTLRVVASREGQSLAIRQVAVEAGKVATTELQAPDFSPKAQPSGAPLVGLGGLAHLAGLAAPRGRVFLHDGKTPAYGAKVLVFAAGSRRPTAAGMVAADGSITPRWQWHTGNESDLPDLDLDRPSLVAWLPGDCGPLVAPLPSTANEPLTLILPRSMRAKGAVTIGGQPMNGQVGPASRAGPSAARLAAPALTGRVGYVRVLAQPEQQGRLNEQFAIDTTAEADGSFELAGLVAGKYRIQAALDQIWLSPSLVLDVTDAPPEFIHLDISEPGGPAVVRVQRAQGELTRSGLVEVVRPTGPLRDRLWPIHFDIDGGGCVHVPALEAGKHEIRVGLARASVEIRPLNESRGEPAITLLTLAQ